MKQPATAEKHLYPKLDHWLRTDKNCAQTWRAGQKPVIRFDVPGPNRRIPVPDVVGAASLNGTWRTHIVEAKKPGSGSALQTAIAQLESVREWAD